MCNLFQDVESDLELAVSNFKALILALLRDPAEKAYFFQVNEMEYKFFVMPILSMTDS